MTAISQTERLLDSIFEFDTSDRLDHTSLGNERENGLLEWFCQ